MQVFQAMLVLRDVSRSLGRDLLLNRASMDFPPDVPTAVLGFDAPGRDAFFRLLAGTDKPQNGAVRLAGRDIAHVRREKGGILRIGPTGAKPSGQRVRKLIDAETARICGLTARMDADVSDLALGERVRLAIAIAREKKPGLILLDSPAGELRGETRERLVADLQAMMAGLEAVVVLAGAADEARGLAGRVVVVAKGRVAQQGAAAEVFARPANLMAAVATSHPALNTVAMVARAGAGMLADGAVLKLPEGMALPAAGACTLAFRPEDTGLERAGEGCVRFVVRAAGAQEIGGRRYVRVTFAGAAWLAPHAAAAPEAGMMLNAFVDRERLMVFDAEGAAVR
jgi:ABC-type sugar transport system ATPase subunit